MLSFPQDIFPKYPGEQRHHVGAILPFDKKDLTSTGRLPTSSNSLVVTTVVGLSVKPAQGAQPQRSVPPTQASEKAKGHRAGLRKHVLLLSRCWRRAMFRVHECVFFAHVFADLSGALTCGKAFSATCTCEGYSSQELWRIEGTQILWEYKGVKTATCCKENHVLESLQRHSGFEAPTASTAVLGKEVDTTSSAGCLVRLHCFTESCVGLWSALNWAQMQRSWSHCLDIKSIVEMICVIVIFCVDARYIRYGMNTRISINMRTYTYLKVLDFRTLQNLCFQPVFLKACSAIPALRHLQVQQQSWARRWRRHRMQDA